MPKVGNNSVLTKKSQVTIPKKVRDFLKLRPGDTVKFQIAENTVHLVPVRGKIEDSYGTIKARKKPEDFQAIRKTVEREIAEEVTKES